METERKIGVDEESSVEENAYYEEEWCEDEDQCGLLKLFGEKKPPLPRSLVPPAGVTYDDYDSDRDMTDEEYRLYSEQVRKSGGFDVDRIPGINMIGQILPMSIDKEKRFLDYDRCSQLAIDDYSLRIKGGSTELEFVKVLKVMGQGANCIRFYITFEAKDFADGGEIKLYQAVVLLKVGGGIEVSSFRLKPLEDKQGTGNHGEEWFWEDHLCHGCT